MCDQLSRDETPVASALAIRDGKPEAIFVGSSVLGHLLGSALLEDTAEPEVADHLKQFILSETMLGAGGVRSLQRTAQRYRPSAYHNGSVWLWETAAISVRLWRMGDAANARLLAARVQGACAAFHGFPEFVRSNDKLQFNKRVVEVYDSANERINKIEQPAQHIQTWTVARLLAIRSLQILEGSNPDQFPLPGSEAIPEDR